MHSLKTQAAKDYNETIKSLQESSRKEGQETYVSVALCDSFLSESQIVERHLCSVDSVPNIDPYEYRIGGGTPLFDTVGNLISRFNNIIPTDNEDVSFLIMVITDGEENASNYWRFKLPEEIRKLQGTDRWTFTFRVPKGYARNLTSLGIHPGNIFEWDQTEEGFREATSVHNIATASYFAGRSAGFTSSKSFYTDMSKVKPSTVKANLSDISGEVEFISVDQRENGSEIKAFCESKTRKPFLKGSAFYQLTKTEKTIQDYKTIAIRDKKSKSVFVGANARQLLGLPYNGNAKVIPGNHGQYDIFVQSTSINRKLVGGTELMIWDKIASM